MPKLTDKGIAGLKPKKARYEKWDGGGLGVRVQPSGVKSFVLVYHFKGRPRRLTLGRYRSAEDVKAGKAADGVNLLSLTQARKAALEAKEKLEQTPPIDPGAEKQKAKEAERKAETVSELVGEFVRLYSRGDPQNPNKRTWAEDERVLNKVVISRWGTRKAKDIARADVNALLNEISGRGAPIMANRTLAILKKMFRWAASNELVEKDPTEFVVKRGIEQKRERALRANNVKIFWVGLNGISYPAAVIIAIKLLLVTAQRRGEVAGIEAAELDEAAALWTIPGARTKNKKPHAVPLSGLALELIRAARIEAAKVEGCPPANVNYLFPALQRDGVLTSIKPTVLTSALERYAKDIVGYKITPHDLRRTASTLMGGESLSIPRFFRDRILNHADSSPGSHYDINEYLTEKRDALSKWGDYLSEVVGQAPANVVEFGVRRG